MLRDQVSQLPLNGRNVIRTDHTDAGNCGGWRVRPIRTRASWPGVDISFSGTPANANQWQVNGANNKDEGSQRILLVYSSVDAGQEFKILRNTTLLAEQFHGGACYLGPQ